MLNRSYYLNKCKALRASQAFALVEHILELEQNGISSSSILLENLRKKSSLTGYVKTTTIENLLPLGYLNQEFAVIKASFSNLPLEKNRVFFP